MPTTTKEILNQIISEHDNSDEREYTYYFGVSVKNDKFKVHCKLKSETVTYKYCLHMKDMLTERDDIENISEYVDNNIPELKQLIMEPASLDINNPDFSLIIVSMNEDLGGELNVVNYDNLEEAENLLNSKIFDDEEKLNSIKNSEEMKKVLTEKNKDDVDVQDIIDTYCMLQYHYDPDIEAFNEKRKEEMGENK